MTGPVFQTGRIGYFGPDGETGREWFEMVRHADGRTLRAFCEMDDLGLSRDVTMLLDGAHRPVDAFVRVIRGGEVLGSTLFLADGARLRCVGRIGGADVLEDAALSGPIGYLGLHPLVGDALIALARGVSRPGEFVDVPCFTNSQAPAGDEGLRAMPVTIGVAYLGEETVEVAAGRFAARAYGLRWKPEWAAAKLWVHGPDALFLKLDWPEIGARYELTEHRVVR
ncbi:MAG: hypothetical protein ACMVO5_00060 [Polymorphobacter sp.]|uniref:hypothetical protein n=1 Tax=Polymorphobacter sp. TaxID=1909290 RepID=UPI003A87C69B